MKIEVGREHAELVIIRRRKRKKRIYASKENYTSLESG
jgi:hypothetical protein